MPIRKGMMGKCFHHANGSPLWHCVYVCVYCMSSNAQAVLIFPFIHSKVKSSAVKPLKDFFEQTKCWLKPPPSPLLSSQQSHFLSSNTLLFQLLCVYGGQTEDPLQHGELVMPYPLTLLLAQTIYKHQPCYVYTFLAQNYRASRPPAFPWHHSGGDLTGPPSLDVSPFRCQFSALLSAYSSLFPSSPLSVLFWDGTGTGQGGMWCHSSMTQTEHPHGHNRVQRGGGKGEGKGVVEGRYNEVSMRCWERENHILQWAPSLYEGSEDANVTAMGQIKQGSGLCVTSHITRCHFSEE